MCRLVSLDKLHAEAYDQTGTLIAVSYGSSDVGSGLRPPTPSLAELFEGTPPARECIATYNAPYEAPSPIYARPFYGESIGELPPLLGTVVIGQTTDANGYVWYQITLENARLKPGVSAEFAWIGEGAMAIYEPCSHIPQVDFSQPDAAGRLAVSTTPSGDQYFVQTDERLTIWWHDAPQSETRDFTYRLVQVAQDGTEALIDECCENGTDVLFHWRVAEGFVGTLRAEVRDKAGTLRYSAYSPQPLRATTQIGYLEMPYLFADAGMVAIEGDATLPLTWVDFPPEAVRYTIISTYDQVVIGEDTDNSDGVQIQWDVPLGYSGALHGEAYDADGTLIGIAHSPPDVAAVTIPPTPTIAELFEGTPPADDCIARQSLMMGDVYIFDKLDLHNPIGNLSSNQGAVVVGQAARPSDGLLFYRITLENAQLNEGVTAELGWVVADYMAIYEPCAEIPNILPEVGSLSLVMTRSGDHYLIQGGRGNSAFWQPFPEAETDALYQQVASYALFQISADGSEERLSEATASDNYVFLRWQDVPEDFVGRLRAEAYDTQGRILFVAYSPPLRAVQRIGSLDMPYLFADAGNIIIEGGATIPVSWTDFPPEAVRYVIISSDDQVVIGEDVDNSDGVEVQWTVPLGYAGTLHGEAYAADGTLIAIALSAPDVGATTIPPTPALSELFEGTPPADECIAANQANFFGDLDIYGSLNSNDVIGTLPLNKGAVVVGQAVSPRNGLLLYQITLENVQLNAGVTADRGWVLARFMTIYEPCSEIAEVVP